MPYKADPISKSKRMISSVVMIVCAALVAKGYIIGEVDEARIVDLVYVIGASGAALLNLWSKVQEARKL